MKMAIIDALPDRHGPLSLEIAEAESPAPLPQLGCLTPLLVVLAAFKMVAAWGQPQGPRTHRTNGMVTMAARVWEVTMPAISVPSPLSCRVST